MTASDPLDDPARRGFAGRRAGAAVTAIARSQTDLDEVAELAATAGGARVRACVADVRDAEALDAIIAARVRSRRSRSRVFSRSWRST